MEISGTHLSSKMLCCSSLCCPRVDNNGPSVLMFPDGGNDIYYWILVLLMFLDILIRVMFGLTGNYIYMRTTMRRVRSVRKHYLGQDSYYQHLATSGGISFLLGVSAYAILWFVSTFMTFII